MSNREYPPRGSSRFAPGLYLNVEIGVSFSGRPHATSMNYSSRNMQERIYRQQEESYYRDHQLAAAISQQEYESHRQTRDYQQQRQRAIGVRPLEQHERGSSAPPFLSNVEEQHSSIVSPISNQQNTSTYQPYRPIQHTSTFPQGPERPLPYTPAFFRLGDDDLPWSVPPWYRPPEPEFASPTIRRLSATNASVSPARLATPREIPSIGPEFSPRRSSSRGRELRRVEDPQRARELEQLHQAMMTVDTFDSHGQEPWAVEENPGTVSEGARSLGWAVSTEVSPIEESPPTRFLPPPYYSSSWEQVGRNRASRSRSSG